jgi:hypothetical protein
LSTSIRTVGIETLVKHLFYEILISKPEILLRNWFLFIFYIFNPVLFLNRRKTLSFLELAFYPRRCLVLHLFNRWLHRLLFFLHYEVLICVSTFILIEFIIFNVFSVVIVHLNSSIVWAREIFNSIRVILLNAAYTITK